jgi:hypothetical protein
MSPIRSSFYDSAYCSQNLLLDCDRIATVRALHSMAYNRGRLALYSSNRMAFDPTGSDDEEEEVTYLNEEQLRAFWLKSGMSAASYNEDTALSKMLLSDNDDDEEDDDYEEDDAEEQDDDDDDVKNIGDEKKNVKTSTTGGKKRDFLSSAVVSPETKIGTKDSLKPKKSSMLNKLLKRSSKTLNNEVEIKKSESSKDEKVMKKVERPVEKKVEEVSLDSNGLPIPAGRSVGESRIRGLQCRVQNAY